LKIGFQADAELNPEIGRGLRRKEPAIDFRSATGVSPDGTPDPTVLQVAPMAAGFSLRGTSERCEFASKISLCIVILPVCC
jgi:hypothetical protein